MTHDQMVLVLETTAPESWFKDAKKRTRLFRSAGWIAVDLFAELIGHFMDKGRCPTVEQLIAAAKKKPARQQYETPPQEPCGLCASTGIIDVFQVKAGRYVGVQYPCACSKGKWWMGNMSQSIDEFAQATDRKAYDQWLARRAAAVDWMKGYVAELETLQLQPGTALFHGLRSALQTTPIEADGELMGLDLLREAATKNEKSPTTDFGKAIEAVIAEGPRRAIGSEEAIEDMTGLF